MHSPRDQYIRITRRCLVRLAFILVFQTALGIALAVSNYKGVCYGFTDGKSPCTLGEYAISEIFIASFISIFLTPIPFIFWGMAIGRIITASKKLRHELSVILTFSLVIAGGMIGLLTGAYFPYVLTVGSRILTRAKELMA